MRVLVVRSCRMPQFQAAVARVRAANPGCEIWALTNEACIDAVTSAGADHAITHRASRISAWRLGSRLVLQLRALRFDHVVIPLMDSRLGQAANLLRLAVVINAPLTSVSAGGSALHTWPRRQFRKAAMAATLLDDLMIVLQMACAAMHRRRIRSSGDRSEVRVLHIINSLGVGGAQTQFAELVNRSPEHFEIDVLVLSKDDEIMRGRLLRADVPITYLSDLAPAGTMIDTIAAFCRRHEFDLVHTWLPVANMVGAAAARLADVPRIVTSIRSMNPGHYPEWSEWWYRVGDALSARIADVVTVNARPLVADHAGWACMAQRRIQVVHNGIDLKTLHDDSHVKGLRLRDELALDADVSLVGCIGRLSTEKDQATFIKALAILRDSGMRVHGVLVGDGATRPALEDLVRAMNLTDRVTFMGARRDSRRIMAGLDVIALTSRVEGFPNVLLEAGLLGVPIVSTAAGGVIDVVGEPEQLCVCGDPRSVAMALASALTNRTQTAARAARLKTRCLATFTSDHMVARWLDIYGLGASAAEKAA